MRRLAFSASILGVVGVFVACGGANSTDLFSGDGTSSGSNTDGGGNNNTSDGSTSGFTGDDGGSGNTTDSGNTNPGKDSGTSGKDSGVTGGTCSVDKGGVASGCNTDEACISPNCTTGTCVKINPANTDYNPICGCDSVNYWNGAVATGFLAAVKGSGQCTNALSCNGAQPGNAKCPVGLGDCAFERPDIAGNACGATIKNPVCWGLPANCPKVTQGVDTCNGGNCTDLCSAIRNQTPYRIPTPACTIM
jgi:hypothetical protein